MDAEVGSQEQCLGGSRAHKASDFLQFSGLGQFFCQNGSSSTVPKDHKCIVAKRKEFLCKKRGRCLVSPKLLDDIPGLIR